MQAVISVSEYLGLANYALRTIPAENMVIEGEVADFKISQGKWVNFDLKDEKAEAKMACFMTVHTLAVPLASGMRVQVTGYAKVFERFGKFSFTVTNVALVGEGALQKAYEVLKEKLRVEGLFDVSRKREIPQFPNRIGLITSSEAAAYGDFLRILNNRWRGVTVLHTPVHVQGQYAVGEILAAFAQLNALPEDERPEVIVLTRGGGSLEDLHAFNSEDVARAVYQSAIPVVVGVGHERDESLCDFVADVRASTPSNAAERVVPDARAMRSEIMMSTDRMHDQLRFVLDRRAHAIDRAVGILDRSIANITESVARVSQRFGYAFERFRLSLVATIDHVNRRADGVQVAMTRAIETSRRSLTELDRVLRSMDPTEVLKRGYALVRMNGRLVRSAASVAPGSRLQIHLHDGNIHAVVDREIQQESLW